MVCFILNALYLNALNPDSLDSDTLSPHSLSTYGLCGNVLSIEKIRGARLLDV